MKKNIFLLLGLVLLSGGVVFSNLCNQNQSVDQSEVYSDEECDEFEVFFGSEEDSPAEPRKEKPKLTPVQLALIRWGTALAVRLENCYDWMKLWYSHIISWVSREKRKA